jgi:hypothetical protein
MENFPVRVHTYRVIINYCSSVFLYILQNNGQRVGCYRRIDASQKEEKQYTANG